ncbi:MAG: cation-translocating P-type ATPase [Thiogranum sp.]|nr:cation-translocating P-type ATPase [Thiogranum sp.]
MPVSARWHLLTPEDTVRELKSDVDRGLTEAEAAGRLADIGPNAIVETARRTPLGILYRQFTDFMIIVLLAAAVISGFIGELQDTIAIIVIVVLNAIIGAVQEYRAERAVSALRMMAAPEAQVVRDGSILTCPATELVPGDRVLLEAGNVVPADLRLIEAVDLQVDESALTGESQAVDKSAAPLTDPESPLGDRINMSYKGTQVNRGRGVGVVVATGMDTELGRIAALLQGEPSTRTPLQRRLTRFGRHLSLAILAICVVIFSVGLLQGQPVLLMLLTAISLAVAAIPEALPAVVTVSLALGARKLSRRNALVRRLPAVETLGSVTYICTDKTGTLTQNRMTLDTLFLQGERRRITFLEQRQNPLARRLGQALALSNDVSADEVTQVPLGEPTEVALFVAARNAGFDKAALTRERPREAELPFDAERKRMTTVHREDDHYIAFVKGAPESVLPLCSRLLTEPGLQSLDRKRYESEAQALASEGYRVLAVACRELPVLPAQPDAAALESDLVLLGLVALIDPPRDEAPAAVADCRSAGITPVMITGDHPGTARAIAMRIGIAEADDPVLTGQELSQLPDKAFAARVRDMRVYARVTPQQKIRIVSALQGQGEFVAMTGDGVNDAPALKRAGIGIAMGRTGTDVAREAADMVLLDDNFATIVSAVRDGRRIFDNIRKFIKYTMTSNSGEIWTLLLAPFLGLPVPLLPIHILWINLVTDGLPGLALSTEPAERNLMQRPPRPPGESIFAHGMWQHMVWVGLLIGALSLIGQSWAYRGDSAHWQTVVFTVLTLAQLFHVLAIRSERDSLLSVGLFSNPLLLVAVLVTVGLQLAVIYVPMLNAIFKTQPLSLLELGVCFGLAALVLVAVELEKWLYRRGWLYVDRA